MASVNVGSSQGTSTGVSTTNPQANGEVSNLSNGNQNPQSAVSTSSINNQSTGASIPLQPANLRTAAIQQIETKTTHKISTAALIPVALLVVIAIASCVYIYVTSKKSRNNL